MPPISLRSIRRLVALSAKPIRALGYAYFATLNTAPHVRYFAIGTQYAPAIAQRHEPVQFFFEKKPSHFFFDDIIPMQGQRSTADSVVARDRVPHSGEVV